MRIRDGVSGTCQHGPHVPDKARPTIHEFDLIHALRRQHSLHTPSVVRGIGDDAAVIASRAGQWTVLTTDLLTEGVHFDLRTASMADIGFRAAAANLSDIAAMGATPQYLLAVLAIPRTGSRRTGLSDVPWNDGRMSPVPRAADRRRYIDFKWRMVSQPDTDRNRLSSQGPFSERRSDRGLSLRDRHYRRRLGRLNTLERTTDGVRRLYCLRSA